MTDRNKHEGESVESTALIGCLNRLVRSIRHQWRYRFMHIEGVALGVQGSTTILLAVVDGKEIELITERAGSSTYHTITREAIYSIRYPQSNS